MRSSHATSTGRCHRDRRRISKLYHSIFTRAFRRARKQAVNVHGRYFQMIY